MSLVGRLILAALAALMLAFLVATARVKGLYSAEMASWVQALGALTALFIAVVVPRNAAQKATDEHLAATLTIARLLHGGIRRFAVLAGLVDEASDDDLRRWENDAAELELTLILQSAAQVRAEALADEGAIESFIRLRGACNTADAQARKWLYSRDLTKDQREVYRTQFLRTYSYVASRCAEFEAAAARLRRTRPKI